MPVKNPRSVGLILPPCCFVWLWVLRWHLPFWAENPQTKALAVSNTVKCPCPGVLTKFQFHSLCPLSGSLLVLSILLVSSFPSCRVPWDGRLCEERKEGHFLCLDRGIQGQKEGACESQKVGARDEAQRRGISWGKKGYSLGWTTTSKRAGYPQGLFGQMVGSGFSMSLKTLPLKKPIRSL